MAFPFTPEQQSVRDAIATLCARFDDDYWLVKDRDGGWPTDFHKAVADAGWLGIAMPKEYGGRGLGFTEGAIMLRTLGESGGGMGAVSTVHTSIGGMNPVAAFGSAEQKKRMLPPLINGEERTCFAVTEPETGFDILNMKTRAVRKDGHYLVSGEKTWISSAQVATRMLILTRTTPVEEVAKPTDGFSLFYTALDRKYIDVREIDKMGRKAVDSNLLIIKDLPIPREDMIGEEGKGFRCILHGINAERILVAAGAVGIGKAALARATEYAKKRVVFGRPIGQNQGIQHPLAESWMELEAADLMVFNAAALYDRGKPCGAEANAAKYLAAEAAFKSCVTAVSTFGGHGYAKANHVERYLREIMGPKVAPVSPQLVKSFIAEKVLGLPKSY